MTMHRVSEMVLILSISKLMLVVIMMVITKLLHWLIMQSCCGDCDGGGSKEELYCF